MAQAIITMSVIDGVLRKTQYAPMIDHDAILNELIRRLDNGSLASKDVAKALGVKPPRISEMRYGRRRIQQHEMVKLANVLEMTADERPAVIYLPVQFPNADVLTEMFAGMLEQIDIDPDADGRAQMLATIFPSALRAATLPLAGDEQDPSAERGPPPRTDAANRSAP